MLCRPRGYTITPAPEMRFLPKVTERDFYPLVSYAYGCPCSLPLKRDFYQASPPRLLPPGMLCLLMGEHFTSPILEHNVISTYQNAMPTEGEHYTPCA
ncbi:hypothetical protein QQF64_035606 [Cirrhinus molitorella]|uniref:Uncharacterized protein n=1 Tax=Cirrhinus molitorella TaxID=172907 RepID=A0ABR3NG91_9TELE